MRVIQVLRRLDSWLARCERGAVVLLLTGLLGLGGVQVIGRNLLASGMFWADELLQHMVLWLGFLGASLATRDQRHLSIDVLARLLPGRWRAWLGLLVDVAALLICVLLTQAAWGFVRSEATVGAVLTFGVPTWLAQSIIPLGFCSIAWRFALHGLATLRQLAPRKTGT
jgi:TRAP-type C4-dicarboxylate transport system permease small subunit